MYLPGIFLILQNRKSELLELFLYNPQWFPAVAFP